MRRPFQSLWFNVIGGVLDCMPRVAMLHKAFDYVCASNIRGDYLEFGVYKGKTFAQAYHLANLRKYGERSFMGDMRFYAFDSFQGLPDSREAKLKSNLFSEGMYSCGVEEFKRALRSKGVDLGRVGIVAGWFADTLCKKTKSSLPIKRASVVWVDCDWYESAVLVLDFIRDYLVDGALVVFDDWFLFGGSPAHGEQRAAAEWLARNPNIQLAEYHRFGWHGNSFIVRRANDGM